MKLTTITFLLFLLINTYAQQGWNDITQAGSYPGLVGVYAVDSDNVWVVGEEGTILNTTNGGTVWIDMNCPVTYSLQNVHFINADTGWVGGDNESITEVMRTTDKGSSWELKTISTVSDYGNYDIEFIYGASGEPPRGFITAGRALVWSTDDYGENWVLTSVGGCGANDLQSICFINKEEGWFVGTPSTTTEVSIVHTTDGGQTYEVQINPTNPDIKLNCVSFANDQHGVAVGNSGTIIYTSDGGQNWEIRPYNSSRWQSVFLTENGKAWTVGQNGNIAYSTDWGYTWTAQQSGVTCELWEVFFINDNEGWIAGGGIGQPGVILHTATGGIVSNIKENKTVTEFELFQNYPNPFNPKTIIKYRIQSLNNVTLKVYDVLGNEVATVINKEQGAGNYAIEFNAEELSSGVYYYNIKAGDYSETKKMLLIK